MTLLLLAFRVGDLALGLEMSGVEEVVRMRRVTRVPLAPASVYGLMNLRGRVLTTLDLRTRLGIPPQADELGGMALIVWSASGDRIALRVDAVEAPIQVDAAQREPIPETLRGELRTLLLGAYKLPDRLLLQLDAARVADLGDAAEADSRVPALRIAPGESA